MVGEPTKSSAETIAAASDLGLLLFAFAIGLQVGLRFCELFKKRGIRFLNVGAAGVAAVAVTCSFHYPDELGLGLYTCALNCTPALAGAFDTARRVGMDDKIVSIGYGLACPFAAFFVVLFIQLLPGLLKIPADTAMREVQEDDARSSSHKQIHRRIFRITNSYYADRTVSEPVQMHMTSPNFSRMQRDEIVDAALPETVVLVDDVRMAVGTRDELAKLRPVGELCDDVQSSSTGCRQRTGPIVCPGLRLRQCLSDFNDRHNYCRPDSGSSPTRYRIGTLIVSVPPSFDRSHRTKILY